MKKSVLFITAAMTVLCSHAQLAEKKTWTFEDPNVWATNVALLGEFDGLTLSSLSPDKTWKVTASSQTVDGIDYTHRLQSNGKDRSVLLETATSGTFRILATSNGSDTRTMTLTFNNETVGEDFAVAAGNPTWFEHIFTNGGVMLN